MSDHVILDVDRLVGMEATSSLSMQSVAEQINLDSSYLALPAKENVGVGVGEQEPLIQSADCRICQEEDLITNMETPCACCGSLKYAHRKCVQHWCNEKRDITCEICHQPYQSGYTISTNQPHTEDSTIDFGGGWTISGSSSLELHDHRFLALADAEHHFLDAEYSDYAASNASGAAFCRSAALILMALLLLRHALTMTNADSDEDVSMFFSLFLLRAVAFLLPCYIMAWAISLLQRRRQIQETTDLVGTQVAFVLPSGQNRGLQFSVSSGTGGSSASPRDEPV